MTKYFRRSNLFLYYFMNVLFCLFARLGFFNLLCIKCLMLKRDSVAMGGRGKGEPLNDWVLLVFLQVRCLGKE